MGRLIQLPDTMAQWPLPRRISPFCDEVSTESAEWFRSFHAFPSDRQTVFDRCKFGLLAALCSPDADKEDVRATCDLMYLFFVFDELTDVLCGREAQRLADITVDALQNPSRLRPAGEPVIGEIARQFWVGALRRPATDAVRARFVRMWKGFVDSVVEQARDRDEGRDRNLEEHMELRKYTIGMEPSFALAELHLDLPEELIEHPLLQALQTEVTDLMIYCNDMVSYPKEYAAGDDAHNIITIVMRQYGLDLDGALDWVGEQFKACAERALEIWPKALALSASYPTVVREELAFYVDHIMNWPRALDCWSFECGRYFGQSGLRVQGTRMVELLPKKDNVEVAKL